MSQGKAKYTSNLDIKYINYTFFKKKKTNFLNGANGNSDTALAQVTLFFLTGPTNGTEGNLKQSTTSIDQLIN